MKKGIVIGVLAILGATGLDACKRAGCRSNVECVDNYDPKAQVDGDCRGCIDIVAANYCPEADVDNKNCTYAREFYSENGADGWIDIWISDSVNSSTANLVYQGRLTNFPVNIPLCGGSDSTLRIVKLPGEYYYEIETQTGARDWGWALFRQEGCRLLDIY